MGSDTFQNKGTFWKTFIDMSINLFCHVIFCLDSLFWHWLASLNLVILLNTIILRKSFLTGMKLRLLPFFHALKISLCVCYLMKLRLNALAQWSIHVSINHAWQCWYLTDETAVNFKLGRTSIVSWWIWFNFHQSFKKYTILTPDNSKQPQISSKCQIISKDT